VPQSHTYRAGPHRRRRNERDADQRGRPHHRRRNQNSRLRRIRRSKASLQRIQNGADPARKKGGLVRPGPVQTQFRATSEIGKQLTKEREIFEAARNAGGKVVVSGTDVATGKPVLLKLDPGQLGPSYLLDYEGFVN